MDANLRKKALVSGCLWMGLGHILYLKQQVKGALYALSELAVLFFIAFEQTAEGLALNFNGAIVKGVRGFITLGVFNPDLPVKQRDHSIFLMIDGLICFVMSFARYRQGRWVHIKV